MTWRGGVAAVLISNFFCENVLRDRGRVAAAAPAPPHLVTTPRSPCWEGHPVLGTVNGKTSGNAPQLRFVKSKYSLVLMAELSREAVLWLCIVIASSFSELHTFPQATSLSALRDIHLMREAFLWSPRLHRLRRSAAFVHCEMSSSRGVPAAANEGVSSKKSLS